MIDNVLDGKLSEDVFSGNCSYLEITPTVTKIYNKLNIQLTFKSLKCMIKSSKYRKLVFYE